MPSKSRAGASSLAAPALSVHERAQLGTTRLRNDATPSTHPWPARAQWPRIREYLLARSLAANPALDPALTAYTPGETKGLLVHPTVAAWHRAHAKPLSSDIERIVFVPCAKTKPWTGPAVSRSRLYSAYNYLRDQLPGTRFVTISEPLGVVPDTHWADFPQYDNPGLFCDDSQRSGLTTAQWQASPFGQVYAVPYDPVARQACLDTLGGVVGRFMAANADRTFTAFVDSLTGPPSTHGLMLDVAMAQSGVMVTRYPKRPAPRANPQQWMHSILTAD